ncbi:MAG: undecaprenyl phosphate-alpha-L-ara4FN deformylase [Acidobacteriota bacterium]|jgi:peptidoglycan/xylan/chitin deacetylase (PgdA/CDA1 family)|nr:undecaprenyl phosphate-alpha-L-ara4FN deformylase [Acidobacteriota bacterium]
MAPTATTRVVLKIDVDTYRGTRDGIPAMIADLAEHGVRASFYWSLGPDRSGRAIFRVFTKPGFLQKMLRTNAAKMYGFKTALYGTLLPAPRIGRRCAAEIRRALEAGHEVGLHAWDHVTWQDRLHRMSPQAVALALDRGMASFTEIFGERPKGFAAPAWFMTDDAFLALEARRFDYLSVSRGVAEPFYPRIRGRVLQTLEIPTTLPTLDEELGQDGITPETYVDRLVERYRPGATEVITVHAETEGLAYRGLFRDLLARHEKLGIETVTAADYAAEWRDKAIARDVYMGEIPGRAGKVARVGEAVADRTLAT